MTSETKLKIKKIQNALVIHLPESQKTATIGQIALWTNLTKRQVSHAIYQDDGETFELVDGFSFPCYKLR